MDQDIDTLSSVGVGHFIGKALRLLEAGRLFRSSQNSATSVTNTDNPLRNTSISSWLALFV